MSTPNPTGPAEGDRPRDADGGDVDGPAPNSVPAPWAKFWLLVLFGGGAVAALLDLFRDRAHADHPWEHGLFFYALYGFVGISLLIVLSKGLRRLVMRREDYYGDDG